MLIFYIFLICLWFEFDVFCLFCSMFFVTSLLLSMCCEVRLNNDRKSQIKQLMIEQDSKRRQLYNTHFNMNLCQKKYRINRQPLLHRVHTHLLLLSVCQRKTITNFYVRVSFERLVGVFLWLVQLQIIRRTVANHDQLLSAEIIFCVVGEIECVFAFCATPTKIN